jgi:hypothetical protein
MAQPTASVQSQAAWQHRQQLCEAQHSSRTFSLIWFQMTLRQPAAAPGAGVGGRTQAAFNAQTLVMRVYVAGKPTTSRVHFRSLLSSASTPNLQARQAHRQGAGRLKQPSRSSAHRVISSPSRSTTGFSTLIFPAADAISRTPAGTAPTCLSRALRAAVGSC